MNRSRISYPIGGLLFSFLLGACHQPTKPVAQPPASPTAQQDSGSPMSGLMDLQATFIKGGKPMEIGSEKESFDEPLKLVTDLRTGELRSKLCPASASEPCERLDEFLSAGAPTTLPEGTYFTVGPLAQLGEPTEELNFVLKSKSGTYNIVGIRNQAGHLEVAFQDGHADNQKQNKEYQAYIQSLYSGKPDLQNPSHQDLRTTFQREAPLWLKAESCSNALCMIHMGPQHLPINMMIRQKGNRLYFLISTWMPGHPPSPGLFFSWMPVPIPQ